MKNLTVNFEFLTCHSIYLLEIYPLFLYSLSLIAQTYQNSKKYFDFSNLCSLLVEQANQDCRNIQKQ